MGEAVTVSVPKQSGAYGVPQLGAEQIIYDVSAGTCQVPQSELARFLYVVEGSRVKNAEPAEAVRNTRVPERGLAETAAVVGSEEVAVPVVATSAAVAHADEMGVDLAAVAGTGADGKVTKPDVVAHVQAAAATPDPAAGPPSLSTEPQGSPAESPAGEVNFPDGSAEVRSPAEGATPVATPAAEAKADELGVPLHQVEGSGVDGKIVVKDVVAHVEAQGPDGEPQQQTPAPE